MSQVQNDRFFHVKTSKTYFSWQYKIANKITIYSCNDSNLQLQFIIDVLKTEYMQLYSPKAVIKTSEGEINPWLV